jgi:O-antigen/teichoic acid export membrane protein
VVKARAINPVRSWAAQRESNRGKNDKLRRPLGSGALFSQSSSCVVEAPSLSAKRLLQMAIAYSASGGSLLVAAAAQLVTFAILARFLGAEQFGLYVVVISITSIAATVCGLGGQESLVRRVARDPSCYPTMLGHALLLLAVSGTILIGLGVLLLPSILPLSADPTADAISYLLILGANLVLYRFIVLAGQGFIAASSFGSANLNEIWYAAIRMIAATLACVFFHVDSVAEWAVWLFVSHMLAALGSALALRRFGRPQFRIVREEISLGLLFCSQFVVRTARQNADMLVLGIVATPEVLGSYGIARRMLDSSYLSIEALNRLVYPGSAAASSAGLHAIWDRTGKVLLASMGVSIVAALAMFILAPVLPLIFGEEYSSVVDFARILGWALVPFAAYAVPLDALGASGQQGQRSLVLNGVNGAGIVLIASATWFAGISGTFATFYLTEITMVVLAWVTLTSQMRADRYKALGYARSA